VALQIKTAYEVDAERFEYCPSYHRLKEMPQFSPTPPDDTYVSRGCPTDKDAGARQVLTLMR
jgi:hypothetical protein